MAPSKLVVSYTVHGSDGVGRVDDIRKTEYNKALGFALLGFHLHPASQSPSMLLVCFSNFAPATARSPDRQLASPFSGSHRPQAGLLALAVAAHQQRRERLLRSSGGGGTRGRGSAAGGRAPGEFRSGKGVGCRNSSSTIRKVSRCLEVKSAGANS